MKSVVVLSSALTALGALSTTADAIVLPNGANFSHYHQYGASHFEARAVVGEDAGGRGIKVPMFQKSKRDLTNVDQTFAFATRERNYVLTKWGKTAEAEEKRRAMLEKRQTIGLSDYGQDNFYFGQVSVGTPKQNFNVILDTGSADFWLVDTDCNSSQCNGVALFDPSASSTFQRSQTPFSITYGTGAVQGTLAADTVSLAGYTVNAQTFAIAEQLAQNSLNEPTSGIMGMGFQSLAQSRATPFWQVLVEQNKLSENLFTFQMARNVLTATSADQIASGGVFTLGVLDSAQYNGNINYVNLSGDEGYWTIALDAISINGQTGTISGDTTSAIDTGTTLIIAPPNVASSIYSLIPGSSSLSGYFGSGSGYYSIPCNTNVRITMTFGGQAYSINSADMTSGAVDNQGNCLGGILGESLGASAPGFIVGNVFLKNVFSVYSYDKKAVGFASLKGDAAQTAATTSGAIGASGGATGATSVASSTATNSVGGAGPPILSSVSGTSGSVPAGGSGLPSPTAATTNDASTPSLTPANGANSNSNTSGAAPSLSSAYLALSSAACLFAMAAGVFVAL